MSVKLLTEQHLVFLNLKGGCTGSSESTLIKMPHCWKSHVTAQLIVLNVVTFSGINCRFNGNIVDPDQTFIWMFDLSAHCFVLSIRYVSVM